MRSPEATATLNSGRDRHLTDERTNLMDALADCEAIGFFDSQSGVAHFFCSICFSMGDTLGGDIDIFERHGVNERRMRPRCAAMAGDRKLPDGALAARCVRSSMAIGLSGINGEFGECTRLYILCCGLSEFCGGAPELASLLFPISIFDFGLYRTVSKNVCRECSFEMKLSLLFRVNNKNASNCVERRTENALRDARSVQHRYYRSFALPEHCSMNAHTNTCIFQHLLRN